MDNSWVKVGAKCVCIDSPWEHALTQQGVSHPVKGSTIYTVSRVEVIKGIHVIFLEGYDHLYVSRSSRKAVRMCYFVGCFRPLKKNTLEDDIKMFKSLLDDIKAPTLEKV